MKSLIITTVLFLVKITLMAQTPEQLLLKQGIVLPAIPNSIGHYSSLVRSGNLIYLSGKGPLKSDGTYMTGKLEKDLAVKEGYIAARLCGIAQLAVLKAELGALSKIKRIIKVIGFVNGTDAFADQPKVVDGFSDLMIEIFGDKGIHARSAVGVASLPGGWPVEAEMVVETEP